MTSPKKIQANRANATKSTGPQTESGKAASSMNAFKHGGWTRRTSLSPSITEQRDQLFMLLMSYWRPVGAQEIFLVADLALIEVKSQLLDRFEMDDILLREDPQQAQTIRALLDRCSNAKSYASSPARELGRAATCISEVVLTAETRAEEEAEPLEEAKKTNFRVVARLDNSLGKFERPINSLQRRRKEIIEMLITLQGRRTSRVAKGRR